MVFGGSRKKDTVHFMGSQPQLEHDRLLGSVPVRFFVCFFFFSRCGGDAGLKGKPVTAWGTAPLSLAPGCLGSHLNNEPAEILHYFSEFVEK